MHVIFVTAAAFVLLSLISVVLMLFVLPFVMKEIDD